MFFSVPMMTVYGKKAENITSSRTAAEPAWNK